jgi:hypothetical protein
MTFSDAIRLGAMLKPQGFGPRALGDRTCALAAAAEAAGIAFPDAWRTINYPGLQAEWPMLRRSTGCPICAFPASMLVIIWHLNDQHRWTRESIADWVDAFELENIKKCVSEEVTT